MDNTSKHTNIIFFTAAGIGDFIWASSALSLIKNYNPAIKILLVAFDSNIRIADKKLEYDKLILINKKYFSSKNILIRYVYKILFCIINYKKFRKYETILFMDQLSWFSFITKYFFRIKNIIGPDLAWFGYNIKNSDAKYYTKTIPMPADSNRVHMSV